MATERYTTRILLPSFDTYTVDRNDLSRDGKRDKDDVHELSEWEQKNRRSGYIEAARIYEDSEV